MASFLFGYDDDGRVLSYATNTLEVTYNGGTDLACGTVANITPTYSRVDLHIDNGRGYDRKALGVERRLLEWKYLRCPPPLGCRPLRGLHNGLAGWCLQARKTLRYLTNTSKVQINSWTLLTKLSAWCKREVMDDFTQYTKESRALRPRRLLRAFRQGVRMLAIP